MEWLKKILVYLGCLAGLMLAGTLLLYGVFLLPEEPMKENVARSHEIFNYEGIYPQIIGGYKASQLDNFTDSVMLSHAIVADYGRSLTEQVMNVARIEYPERSMVQSLNDYANDVDHSRDTGSMVTYPRYWHGYLVLLKPLLLLFDYGDIRYLNMILQTLLFLIFVWKGNKLFGKRFVLSSMLMLLVLNPISEALSLQFSWVYYIALLGGLFLMISIEKNKSFLNDWRLPLFFIVVGAATSYFDFLTYPLFTFGICAVILLGYLEKKEKEKFVAKSVTCGVKCGAAWGFGYLGMWSGKWLIASILLKENIVLNAWNQITIRSSAVSEDKEIITFLDVLIRNIRVLVKWPIVLLVIGVFIWLIGRIIKTGLTEKRKILLTQVVPYLIVILLPVAWYAVTMNHSYAHYWFTYRELAISAFTAFFYLGKLPRGLNTNI